jgi:hypothetical protein
MEDYRKNRRYTAGKFAELGDENPYFSIDQLNNEYESESGISNLIKNIKIHFGRTYTKEEFIKKFACDKDAFKNSQYCSSSSQPIETINPIFSCIEKKEEKDGTKITRGKNFIMFKEDEKTFWAFNKDKKWQQIVGGKIVRRGSWLCNGDSEYLIYSEDEVYSSNIYRWVPYSGSKPDDKKSSSPKPTWKNTTLTIEDLKNGRTVSMGMKGPVISEIQKLLISAGYKDISKSGEPDNLFGRRTKTQVKKFQSENKDDKGEQLKDDGIVGTKTINALLKKSDEKMKSAAQSEIPQKLRLAGKEFGQIPTPPREQIPSINLPDRNKIQLPNVPGVKTK